MGKEYLLSLEYGILAVASVALVASGAEVIKNKIKEYIKKANSR